MVDSPYIAPALEQSVSLRRQVTFEAMRVFSGWGYREMQVPLLEHFDTLKHGLDEQAIEKSLRFVDHAGNVMMLRTDVTPAIAKGVAYQLLSGAFKPPIRASYANKIVRIDRGYDRGARESYQLGVELIGVAGVVGDLEVLLIALEFLDRLGVKDHQFNVTDHGIARHLLNETGAPARIRHEVLDAITARDPHHASTILRDLGIRDRYVNAIAILADLEGGLHQLDQLVEILPSDKHLAERIATFRKLFGTLAALGYKRRIRIDMAELGGQAYYDGLAFNIVSESAGRSLGRGGRYDNLLSRYGARQPAAGFSLSSEALVDLLHPKAYPPSRKEPQVSTLRIDPDHIVEGFQSIIKRRSHNQPARITTHDKDTP